MKIAYRTIICILGKQNLLPIGYTFDLLNKDCTLNTTRNYDIQYFPVICISQMVVSQLSGVLSS